MWGDSNRAGTNNLLFTRYRPPDWRWQIATGVVEGRLRLPDGFRDNPTVQLIARLQKITGSAGPPIAMQRALRIALSNPFARTGIDAHIVAGVEPAVIHKLFGPSVEVLELYEMMWFDVRPRRDDRPWLAANIFRCPWDPDPLGRDNVRRFLLQVARDCGIDHFVEVYAAVVRGTAYAVGQRFSPVPARNPADLHAHLRRILAELLVEMDGGITPEGNCNDGWRMFGKSVSPLDPELESGLSDHRIDAFLAEHHGIDVRSFAFFGGSADATRPPAPEETPPAEERYPRAKPKRAGRKGISKAESAGFALMRQYAALRAERLKPR